MKRIALALVALFAFSASAIAQFLPPPVSNASIPISITSATTTLLVTGIPATSSPAKQIAVTSIGVIASGTGTIQFIAGTGATCGTGTVNLTGNYSLIAQVGFMLGIGAGAVLIAPQGFSICAVTNAAVGMQGSMAYAIY